jgi:hypothetical protein
MPPFTAQGSPSFKKCEYNMNHDSNWNFTLFYSVHSALISKYHLKILNCSTWRSYRSCQQQTNFEPKSRHFRLPKSMNTVTSLTVYCLQTEVCNRWLPTVLQFIRKLFVYLKPSVLCHYSAKNTMSTKLLFSTVNRKVFLSCKNEVDTNNDKLPHTWSCFIFLLCTKKF